MKKTNLGKGLSELLGGSEEFKDFKTNNSNKLTEIKIDSIIAGKYQPRTTINQISLAELTESISEKGVLQPIVVKYRTNDKYEIIAGERRYRASIAAGKEDIPAIILDISEQDAYEIAIIENIQREKLNPLDEALAIEKLIKTYKYDQELLAKRLGKSRTHIANTLRLLLLPAEIQEMLNKEKLSMGHARALINKKNAIALAKKAINENLSVRDIEKLVKQEAGKGNKRLLVQHGKQKQVFLNKIAMNISKTLNKKVAIKHNGKKGKLVIEFNKIEELDTILNKVKSNF
jgi:ParB family transcriptional regulator, chromosome partitioning protein